MFQFPACPPVRLWIHLTVTGSSPAGFPHSDIRVSLPACGSSRLFAACHVLLRLLVPRHPPCALVSLIVFLFSLVTLCFYSQFVLWFVNSKRNCRSLRSPLLTCLFSSSCLSFDLSFSINSLRLSRSLFFQMQFSRFE